jgi:hypothetical protein
MQATADGDSRRVSEGDRTRKRPGARADEGKPSRRRRSCKGQATSKRKSQRRQRRGPNETRWQTPNGYFARRDPPETGGTEERDTGSRRGPSGPKQASGGGSDQNPSGGRSNPKAPVNATGKVVATTPMVKVIGGPTKVTGSARGPVPRRPSRKRPSGRGRRSSQSENRSESGASGP